MNSLTLTPQQFESLKPVIDAQARQHAAETYQARLELVAELEALSREEWKTVTPLETKAGESLARLQSCERAYSEAKAEAEAWAAKRERARWDFGFRRDRLQAELRNTAPGEIEALEIELRDRLRVLPDELVCGERGTGELTFSGMLGRFVHQRTTVSNAGELDGKMAACRTGLAECEKLRHQAIAPGELAERLASIRRTAGLDAA